MKFLKLCFILFSISLSITSCGEDNDDLIIIDPIIGTWERTAHIDTDGGIHELSCDNRSEFTFKNDFTIEITDYETKTSDDSCYIWAIISGDWKNTENTYTIKLLSAAYTDSSDVETVENPIFREAPIVFSENNTVITATNPDGTKDTYKRK